MDCWIDGLLVPFVEDSDLSGKGYPLGQGIFFVNPFPGFGF